MTDDNKTGEKVEQAPAEKKFVTIHCSIPSGLELRLHEMKKNIAGEDQAALVDIPSVKLIQGDNTHVPADFWQKWMAFEGHAQSQFVTAGAIYEVKPKEEGKAEGEAAPAKDEGGSKDKQKDKPAKVGEKPEGAGNVPAQAAASSGGASRS